jgi:hypothetical protein
MSLMIAGVALFRRVPAAAWAALGVALALLGVWRWHDATVANERGDGARAQAVADRAHYEAAASAAATEQRRRVAVLATRQSVISKGFDDALHTRHADLARRYDDLRLRWAVHRADPRGTGVDRATAVPGPAARDDDAACAARGWVSFDTAAAAAQAADTAIAKDDAWIEWAARQAASWPD